MSSLQLSQRVDAYIRFIGTYSPASAAQITRIASRFGDEAAYSAALIFAHFHYGIESGANVPPQEEYAAFMDDCSVALPMVTQLLRGYMVECRAAHIIRDVPA